MVGTRRLGTGSVSQALQDVASWVDDVRRSAAQTADKVTAEVKSRSPERGHFLANEDRLAAALMSALAERTLQLKSDADELARLLERAAAQIESVAPQTERPQSPASKTSPAPQEQKTPTKQQQQTPTSQESKTPKDSQTPKQPAASERPTPAEKDAAPSSPNVPSRLGRKRNVSEGIRLLTMQMAVAGSSREEIRHRLRKEFKVEHADQVLDEVLEST